MYSGTIIYCFPVAYSSWLSTATTMTSARREQYEVADSWIRRALPRPRETRVDASTLTGIVSKVEPAAITFVDRTLTAKWRDGSQLIVQRNGDLFARPAEAGHPHIRIGKAYFYNNSPLHTVFRRTLRDTWRTRSLCLCSNIFATLDALPTDAIDWPRRCMEFAAITHVVVTRKSVVPYGP